jgi:hypothetical protein
MPDQRQAVIVPAGCRLEVYGSTTARMRTWRRITWRQRQPCPRSGFASTAIPAW